MEILPFFDNTTDFLFKQEQILFLMPRSFIDIFCFKL